MMFTAKGAILGKPYSVTYSKLPLLKAALVGDIVPIKLVLLEAKYAKSVGPVGCYLKPDINDPLAALFLIQAVFDEGLEVTGDIPQPPEVPEEAVV